MANNSSSPSMSMQDHFQKAAQFYERSTGGATRRVAKHLTSLAHPINASANILDNATGTGILVDELLNSINDQDIKQSIKITAVDDSSAMIDLLKKKAEESWNLPAENLNAQALSAERLDSLATDSFDHSFTNFGFMFFKDPSKAMEHLYRTLRPGGTAFITTWHDLGYVRIIDAAGEVIRPGQPKLKFPFGDEWYDPGHLENLSTKAGFKNVEMSQFWSQWSGSSVQEFTEVIGAMIGPLLKMQGWTEDDLAKLPSEVEKVVEKYPDWIGQGGKDGAVSISMLANLAVCTK